MKRIYLLAFLVLTPLFVSMSNSVNSAQLDSNPTEVSGSPSPKISDPTISNGYTADDPIKILNDTQLEIFPGNGTEINPYRIEYYSIDVSVDEYVLDCINIKNTTKHILITNCLLISEFFAIYIRQVANDTIDIIANDCLYNNSKYPEFEGKGIYLKNVNGAKVTNNTITLFEYGIESEDSPYSYIADNYFTWNLVGIRVHESDNCEVLRNVVTNHPDYLSTAAVYLYYAGSSIVNGNNLSSGGFYIYEDWELLSLENNLIGGRQFGFFVNEENLELSDHIYSQIILYECANVNISFQIIQNVTIGIQLYNCVKIYIHDCSLYNNRHGIEINRGGNHVINNNEFRKNYLGLHSYLSINNLISYNMIKENIAFGVYLLSCEKNIIHHNLFIDNNIGNPMYSDYPESIQSQAFDETRENILASSMDMWYDDETKLGNYWNDYAFSCSDSSIEYRIAADPISHSYFYVDSYPLFIDMSGCYTPSTTSTDYSFVVFLVLLPAVVFVLRKRD